MFNAFEYPSPNQAVNVFIIPKQTYETPNEPNLILCQFHLIQVGAVQTTFSILPFNVCFICLAYLIDLIEQTMQWQKNKMTHMWHPSCYPCYKHGHKLYRFVFSNFSTCNNIMCVSFDWKDIFRFYKSMYIVNHKCGLHDE